MAKVLFFGAHSDDNVLSAGQTIAACENAVLVTVFAGAPENLQVLTAYDQLSGFKDSQDAYDTRRNEDKEAAFMVGAKKIIQLDHVDSQYGQPVNQAIIVQDMQRIIREEKPDMIVSHLGVNHTDHVFVNESFMEVVKLHDIPAYLYEDLPNRVLYPDVVMASLDRVRGFGFEPVIDNLPTEHLGRKLEAMFCYHSQLKTLDAHLFTVPERLWKIK